MKKNTNNAQLLAKGVPSECLFMYQRWIEMLDLHTMDTYQYRVMNSYVAMTELIDNLESRISGIHTTDYNVVNNIAEIREILSKDIVLEKNENVFFSMVQRLFRELEKKDKLADSEKKSILYKLKYFVKKISTSYFFQIIEELHIAISDATNDKIDILVGILVSQCIFLKWSTQALYGLVSVFEGVGEFREKWERFVSTITRDDEPFYVFINLPITREIAENWQGEKGTFAMLGLSIYSTEEILIDHADVSGELQRLCSSRKYARFEVKAKDKYASAYKGISRLSEGINVASFFALLKPWDVQTARIITLHKENRNVSLIESKYLYATHEYVQRSRTLLRKTTELISGQPNSKIVNLLKSSFSYANMSRASFFQEEKYLNLWVALEALVQSAHYENTITYIKDTVSAALCLKYFQRLIKNFYNDCKRCGVVLRFSDTTLFSSHTVNNRRIVADMSTVLSDTVLFSELQLKCNTSTLLLHRANEMHELMNGDNLAERISLHNKRVRWQLQRLYRLRNDIAHSAHFHVPSLSIYIEHLFDYLVCFITEIVECNIIDADTSIEEVFEIIRDNYGYFEKNGKNTSSYYVSAFLKSGIMEFLP